MTNKELNFKNLPNIKEGLQLHWIDTGLISNDAKVEDVVKKLEFSYLGTTENGENIYTKDGYNYIFNCESDKTIKYAKVILSTTVKLNLVDAYKLYQNNYAKEH